MKEKIFYNPILIKLLILTVDILFSIFSFVGSILLISNFSFPNSISYIKIFSLIAIVRGSIFLILRTQSFIIRYLGFKDLMKLYFSLIIGSVLLLILSYFLFNINSLNQLSVWLIDLILLAFMLSCERYLMRFLHESITTNSKEYYKTILFGAGELGSITAQMLNENKSQPFQILAIFDDNPKVHKKNLNGIPVYNPSFFKKIVTKYDITHAILSIQKISTERKKDFVELCLNNNIIIQQVPPVEKWLNGELNVKTIQNINVEELLSRPPIKLDYENIAKEIKGKIVLVTGGAGSIGSEIVRQCIKFQPKKIIIIDQAESPLVEIGLEVKEELNFFEVEYIILDIRNKPKVDIIINTHKPNIIFHAAAYKHVPIMEAFPSEAVNVNIGGTKNLADAAIKFGVQKFVMISTDKAVNPTNVMGASKRIAEIYIQSLNSTQNKTSFITTRFGNVLGSNGSVLLRFKKQIEARQPITVTHPDIIRYFMTIPEACQLVLEAGALGNGGEIFIFDMGEPVKILDLAVNTIKLAGLRPYIDINITFTGLRPGEKLFEELLNDSEKTIPTHNEKIKKAKTRSYNNIEVSIKINHILSLTSINDEMVLVKAMKDLVPEFVSTMSVFSTLDQINKTI
jgi:FlaA1/EpsC-like NDP-sugar epimerase